MLFISLENYENKEKQIRIRLTDDDVLARILYVRNMELYVRASGVRNTYENKEFWNLHDKILPWKESMEDFMKKKKSLKRSQGRFFEKN